MLHLFYELKKTKQTKICADFFFNTQAMLGTPAIFKYELI